MHGGNHILLRGASIGFKQPGVNRANVMLVSVILVLGR